MNKKPKPVVPSKAAALLPEMVSVFVYGTLKQGFPLHRHWMEGAVLVQDGDELGGCVLMSLGPYPALLKFERAFITDPDACGVIGQVWSVPVATFKAVQAMEEGAGYSTIDVVTDGGHRCKCFAMTFVEGNYEWSKIESKKAGPHYDVVVTDRDVIPF